MIFNQSVSHVYSGLVLMCFQWSGGGNQYQQSLPRPINGLPLNIGEKVCSIEYWKIFLVAFIAMMILYQIFIYNFP